MLMLDICSGLGGASQAMKKRGWDVLTLDNDPAFDPDIIADVRTWCYTGARPDLIWCSPPCVEFSRESMPWSKTGDEPDMSIVLACHRLIAEIQPRYWVIENVRGAVRWFRPYLGSAHIIIGPFFLWGHFPDLSHVYLQGFRKKESYSSLASAERARIPFRVSNLLAVAIEAQAQLLLPATSILPATYAQQ